MSSEAISLNTKSDTPKTRELAPGVKPIYAWLMTKEEFEKYKDKIYRIIFLGNDEKSVASKTNLADGINLFDSFGYKLSPINGLNKEEPGLIMCTSLVVAGQNRITNENISFLTHQFPINLMGQREKFLDDLKKYLIKIKENCNTNTVDAVIIGGQYLSRHLSRPSVNFRGEKTTDSYEYMETVRLLGTSVNEVFGFEPVVVNGPKTQPEPGSKDRIFYDNQNRRLYYIRSEINTEAGDFLPSDDLDKQSEKWNKH